MVAQAIVEAVVGGAKVVIGGSIVVIGSDPVIGGATVVIGGPIVVIGGADSPSHNSTSAEIRFLLAVNSGVSESRCEYKSEQCD